VSFASSATTQTLTGLTNGITYRFDVAAVNAVGTGPRSSASNAVVPVVATVPGAPTIGLAVAGDGVATVSWTAPESDGGSAILGYVVTPYIGFASQGPRYFASTATTQTVTGLTNGTTYRFQVRAWNAVGVSPFSGTSNAVTPTPTP
jgi:predicted phage tail protein